MRLSEKKCLWITPPPQKKKKKIVYQWLRTYPGCKTETNGATLKLSISCLPNFLQVSQELQVLKAFSTSSFTALHSSAQNFWMFLKFSNFFLICSFHKNHRFSGGLSYLPVYCFSLVQWIFIFFVIFATACKPEHMSVFLLFIPQ